MSVIGNFQVIVFDFLSFFFEGAPHFKKIYMTHKSLGCFFLMVTDTITGPSLQNARP